MSQNGTMIFNILDNTTELWMTKYIIGKIFSSGGATLYMNPSDLTVEYFFEKKCCLGKKQKNNLFFFFFKSPTDGCLQYQTGLTGTIKTFNFDSTGTSAQHLASQFYASCIRLRKGYCCVQYQVWIYFKFSRLFSPPPKRINFFELSGLWRRRIIFFWRSYCGYGYPPRSCSIIGQFLNFPAIFKRVKHNHFLKITIII